MIKNPIFRVLKNPLKTSRFLISKTRFTKSIQNPILSHFSVENKEKCQNHSTFPQNVTFTNISDLNPEENNKTITLRTRLQASRIKSNVIFLQLRQNLNTIQAVGFLSETMSDERLKLLGQIPRESIIDITGIQKTTSVEIKSCSVKKIEIHIISFNIVSKSAQILPFQIEDAKRAYIGKTNDLPGVQLATRLDDRCIDLRTPANQSIFRIKSAISNSIRNFLVSRNFIEVNTPKIIGGSSEGGAEVFHLKYFEKDACLAQSPQLYKQMMILSDFDRVFEIGPVFRAEKANTHRHLCEFTGIDIEMTLKNDYFEIIYLVFDLFTHVFQMIESKCSLELENVKNQFNFVPFKISKVPLIFEFKEAVEMLNLNGINQLHNEDLSTANEKAFGELVRVKYDSDFYFLHRYPESCRPFYTKVCPIDSQYTCSFDVFMRGEEIMSGSERIHDFEILKSRALSKGMNIDTIKDYLKAFQFGAQPHGGFGLGLERIVMLYLCLGNIRLTSAFPRDPQRISP